MEPNYVDDASLCDGLEEHIAREAQGGNERTPLTPADAKAPGKGPNSQTVSQPDPPGKSAPPPRRSELPRKVIPYDAYRNRPAVGLNGSPPYSEDCEKGVICSMFLAPGKVSGLIDPKAFFIPAYRILHDAIYEWPEPDKGVDFFWLVEQLTNRGQLDEVGGKAALSELFSFVLTPDNACHYIQIVQEKATLRQVIAACEKAARQCRDHDMDPGLIIKEAQILMDEALHGLNVASHNTYYEVDLDNVASDEEPVAKFPLEALPDRFRKPVEELMRHYRVPALLPATCALVINSVALGRGIVTKSNTRRTFANLYPIIGARSGSGKTPPYEELMTPLMNLQKESFEEFKTNQKPQTEAELKLLGAEIQGLLKHGGNDPRKFSDAEDNRRARLAELLQRKSELEDKLQYTGRLWTEDFTSEALGILLANNKEQMSIMTDDGGLVIYNLLGRYTDGDVKDDVLLCKAKTVSAVPVDRVGRESVLLYQPCVAMLVLTQPDLLHKLFGTERLLVGGFLARTLAADSKMQIQDETDESEAEPDSVIMAEWNDHIQSLVKMFRFAEEPYWLDVEPAVRKLSREYFNRCTAKARGALSDVDSFALRWCERAWEIAMNLHMGIYGVEWGDHPARLSAATFSNALLITDFFAERQLEVLQRPRIESQQKKRSRLEEVFADNKREPMTLRTLRCSHGISKDEVISSVKSHPNVFGIIEIDPTRGGSKSTLVFLKSNPPPGLRLRK